jgi:hypothetical protein
MPDSFKNGAYRGNWPNLRFKFGIAAIVKFGLTMKKFGV